MKAYIIFGSGICFFLASYIGFEYWYRKYWLKIIAIRDETRTLYDDCFVRKTPERVLYEMLGVGAGLGFLCFLIFWPKIYFSLSMGIFIFWWGVRLPRYWLKKFVRPKRVKQFSNQMVDGLTLMGNGLKSGLNVPQTLQIVVDEMPPPISQEFGLVLNENKVGLSLEEAFVNLAKRIPSEDVTMFVTSVNILRETGGNIAETFTTIVKTIRDRLKLQAKIEAMTAQGMTSAIIVSSLPWLLGVMMYFLDPVMMRPMFTTIPGFAILILIAIIEAIGFFVILKIVRIRV